MEPATGEHYAELRQVALPMEEGEGTGGRQGLYGERRKSDRPDPGS